MTLIFEHESGQVLGFDEKEIAKKVIDAAVDYIECPYESQVNIVLTGNEQIKEVNREFRKIDKETDVLSFPAIDFEKPGDFSIVDDDDEYFDMESGELMLGDMMISVDRVFSQAEEYGHSVKREYAFLIAHSMLHLFGFDHMTKEEAQEMEKMQKEILDELGITRD